LLAHLEPTRSRSRFVAMVATRFPKRRIDVSLHTTVAEHEGDDRRRYAAHVDGPVQRQGRSAGLQAQALAGAPHRGVSRTGQAAYQRLMGAAAAMSRNACGGARQTGLADAAGRVTPARS